MRHRHAAAVAILLAALAGPRAASARTMQVMESLPAGNAVIHGNSTAVSVRFDGPVDHASAVLELWRDGAMVARLHARLDSEPSTLFARAGDLRPGAYTLHWRARPAGEHEDSQGDINFSVR